MIAGSQEMSVRHSSFQFLDEAELEQALSIAEDAREEAARVAHELDVSHALLAQRERELLALQVEMEKRETEAAARLREMEDRLLKGEARDKLLAEELQMAIEELRG
jgi:hypothetical protein